MLSITDLGYTGQRDLGDMGLMDYKARFYSPYLNHFTQPDTIVPEPSNPQAWNKYSYALNNPIRYNDPTGHAPCDRYRRDDGPHCFRDIDAPGGRRLNNDSDLFWENEHYQDDCWEGRRQDACPGGAQGLIVFGVTAIVTAGAAEFALLGGGAAAAADAAFYQAAIKCLKSAVCRWLTGTAGGLGIGGSPSGDPSNTVTVGRWMSPLEYYKMLRTNQVQPGLGGVTSVSYPASPSSYGSQAASGSVYVEFDVAQKYLFPGGKSDWFRIISTDSAWAQMLIKSGQVSNWPDLPSIFNLKLITSK